MIEIDVLWVVVKGSPQSHESLATFGKGIISTCPLITYRFVVLVWGNTVITVPAYYLQKQLTYFYVCSTPPIGEALNSFNIELNALGFVSSSKLELKDLFHFAANILVGRILCCFKHLIHLFHMQVHLHCSTCTTVYPKVSGLAAWSENCKWCSSLPLDAIVSLSYESV
jgi:hypothetical protein